MAEWWNMLAALRALRTPAPRHTPRPAPYALADPRAFETHDEFGASGTASFSGDVAIGDDEYNPILRWPNAVRVYEEMRRSTPACIAALRVLKLPLLRATFEIRPPKKGDAHDQAIADFCTWAILRTGAMRDPWLRVLRNMLLMLDFGFSANEIVWNVGTFDGRPVFDLWRLAPRLPKTLQGWKVNTYGELQAMVQYAPRGEDWQELTIPADYLCVVVNEREGDNYNGLSVLRGAYKPWYYMNQLEHIDMIRHHRFGSGLPEAKATDNTKLTRPEKLITENTLRTIASSEASYIITPSKLDFKIHFPPPGDTGIVKSMEYHSFSIARSILAQFLNNQAEGMNTNRTKTLSELFSNLLEAMADELASDFNRQVIVRLCDQNFDMTGREYPAGTFSNVNPVNMSEVSTIFKDLGAGGFVTPDDDLETWLRDIAGAPAMQAGVDRVRTPAPMGTGTGGQPAADDGVQPADDDTADPIAARDRDDAIIAAAARLRTAYALGTRKLTSGDGMILLRARNIELTRQMAGGTVLLDDTAYAENGRHYGRQPNELERRIMALAEIPDMLDQTVETFTASMIALRKTQLKKAAHWLAARGSLAGVTPDLIPMQDAGDAYAIVRETQQELEAFGGLQVRHELMRQGAPASLFAREPPGDVLFASRKKELADGLTASARSFADWTITEWRSDILDAAVRLRRTGVDGDDLETELLRELEQRAEQGVLRFTKQKVNEAYAVGRHAEAEKHSDVIARVIQSCLLDRNSCKACIQVDGKEMPYGSAEQKRLSPPYRNCSGKENCRCTQLFIFQNPDDRAGAGTVLASDDRRDHHVGIVADVGRQIATTLRDAQSRQRATVHTDVHLPSDQGRTEDVEYEYGDDGRLARTHTTVTPITTGNGNGDKRTGDA